MRKSYVLAYTSAFSATHKTLTDVLDELDPYCDWHAPFEHCIFFTSTLSANELAQHFETKLGVGAGRLYLVAEVSANKQGRLPERGWRLLNNPNNPRGA